MQSTESLWLRSNANAAFPPLAADLQVDVAVVGGGITGLTTALLLADAGKRVAVLEGRQVAAGVTGRTTAHLTEVVDTRYHELESSLGAEAARLVRAASRDAIETIALLSSKTECDFQRVNGYLFTERESQMSELDAELLAAERAGCAVSPSRVPLPLGVRGALCFENQAQFQPLAWSAEFHSEPHRRTTGRREPRPGMLAEPHRGRWMGWGNGCMLRGWYGVDWVERWRSTECER